MATPRDAWDLDPAVTFLNHGSFGACPREVLDAQAAFRARMERQPVLFLDRELPALMDGVRAVLAAFLHADAEGLAFVPNATTGVNTVLASLRLSPGDELLTTDHAYNACRNALEATAARTGARVVVARIPFPLASADVAADAVLPLATPRTRFALVDHVTSPTALVLPVERIVASLQAKGIDVLVDGAHAPGMVPLDLESLGAAYYTGNCHKWLCAPKGAAFLHVRADRRAGVHPLVTSHGYNSRRTDRSRFRLEFDWTGTADPTPFLCVPFALETMQELSPETWADGWPGIMTRNRELALQGRDVLCRALGCPPPCPDAMVGSMAAVPLPDAPDDAVPSVDGVEPLQTALWERHGIEVPVPPWPSRPQRLVRVSAQLYNRPDQYEALARALRELLDEERAARPRSL